MNLDFSFTRFVVFFRASLVGIRSLQQCIFVALFLIASTSANCEPIRLVLFTGYPGPNGDASGSGMYSLSNSIIDELGSRQINGGTFVSTLTNTDRNQALQYLQSADPNEKLIIIGHSFGADTAVEVASLLGSRTVDLLVTLDEVGGLFGTTNDVISSNVLKAINYYQTEQPGVQDNYYGVQNIIGATNINAEAWTGQTLLHTTIDNNQMVQELIIQDVLSVLEPELWFNLNTSSTILSQPGESFNLGDDDHLGSIPLNFTFPFYGQDYNEIYFNSNGSLTFGDGRDSWDNYSLSRCGTDQFGQSILPMIAPFFDDHDNRYGGTLSYLNSVPGVFVATWEDVPLYQYGLAGGDRNSFQAVLFGPGNPFGYDPGRIIFNYGDLSGTGGTADSGESIGTATVGLRSQECGRYLTPFDLGIGSVGGLITPSDFPLLTDRVYIDPLVFDPIADGSMYGVSALPFSALPGLAGYTSNVPLPGTLTLMLTGLGLLSLTKLYQLRKTT